jgi:hypothetical protein
MFTRNTQRHSSPLTSRPPMTGPAISPRPETPPQIPMASPRCSAGKAFVMMLSVSGIIVAAPRPWSTRNATSCSMFWASPQSADVVMKISRPPRYRRRRPKMSPRRPAATGNTPVIST